MLGHDTRSFLTVVRSLGRRGLEVHTGWCPADAVAATSRHIAVRHEIPHPGPRDEAWKTSLIELLQRERFALVVPTDDPTLIPLQRNRGDFESHARVYLLSDEAFDVTFDKIKTHELAQSLGVPVPVSATVTSEHEIDAALARLAMPVVVKPRASFSADRLFSRNWVRRVFTREEAEQTIRQLLARGPVQVQENFAGLGVGVELLAAEGEVLMIFQHERVHEPLSGGGSSYRRSVAVTPALGEAARSLMRALSYTGVAMVEFKVNPRTGEFTLIEINGRFWGSLPLAVAAGADFPVALYDLLTQGRREFPQGYRLNLHCRNLKSDLKWQWTNLWADKRDPTLATRPLWRVAAEVRHLLLLRERSDTFVLDDLRPGFVEVGRLLGGAWQAAKNHVKRRTSKLPPLRSRLEQRARDALAASGPVLFVCLGNICRSPFAEICARAHWPDRVKVASSGTFPVPGRASPAVACEVAREMGLSLDGHRSSVLTGRMVDEAGVILVFDESNRRSVLAAFPQARRKVHLLGALSGRGLEEVRDPFGGDETDFRDVYRQISELVRSVEWGRSGAEGGSRTRTGVRPHDPESCASANSATSARPNTDA